MNEPSKISQIGLASKLGISAPYLRLILFEGRIPSPKMCLHLEKTSGIPKEDWMFCGRDNLVEKLEGIYGKINRLWGGQRLRGSGSGMAVRLDVLESKLDRIIELLTQK